MTEGIKVQFERAMWEIYERAKKECGYSASRFCQMLTEKGGLETAGFLLDAPQVSEGYLALSERGRLDLTVESYALRPEFQSLFTSRQLETARNRLAQYGGTIRDPIFLRRVVLKNYKSIASCDVQLRALMFLVGPNGAGKSNFLDSLRFVTDSLRTSLDHAMRDRGGIKEVRRRSGGHPTHFGIRLEFVLPDGTVGSYAFRVGAVQQAGYEVQREECSIQSRQVPGPIHFFVVRSGVVESSVPNPPAAANDRLYLVNASGLPAFRPVYDALSRMGFYNINPQSIRELQSPDAGELLARDAANISSVLSVLGRTQSKLKARIEEYLSKVVPGVRGVETKAVGPKETLEFRQSVAGATDPWRFFAANMSDGTLRALGVLVSLFQGANGQGPRVPLVGIEEPEVALHPAAAGVLFDSLVEASRRTQVLVTSHSPDLLDNSHIETDSILAVDSLNGSTRIAPLDPAGRTALKERLYTVGELLRLNQLAPDPSLVPEPETQLKLFERDS